MRRALPLFFPLFFASALVASVASASLVGSPFTVRVDGVPHTARIFNAPPSVTAAAWYQYDTPDADSANTARDVERSSTHVVAFVQAADGLHIVNIFDRPNDGSGGTAALEVMCLAGDCLAGSSILEDDPTSEDPRDTYTCTPGHCEWTWAWSPCCTDGNVWGPIAPEACVNLKMQLTASSGLTKLAIASPIDDFTHEYIQFPLTDGVGPEVTLENVCDQGIEPPASCCPDGQGYVKRVFENEYDNLGSFSLSTQDVGPKDCASIKFY